MPNGDGLLARMLVTMINAREAESARVARILHDDVGQVLSAVGLQLGVLRMDLQEKAPEIVEGTGEIQKMLEQAMVQVRDLSYALNPSIVERVGLHFALERLIARYREQYSGTIRFFYELQQRPPQEVANSFYKIAEQALDNAVRHSNSTQIQVIVRAAARSLSMEIRDNGRGFAADAAWQQPVGFGLPMLRLYAERADLALKVKSEPAKGASVKVTFTAAAEAKLANPERAEGGV